MLEFEGNESKIRRYPFFLVFQNKIIKDIQTVKKIETLLSKYSKCIHVYQEIVNLIQDVRKIFLYMKVFVCC